MVGATLWYYPAYDHQEERPVYCPNCATQIEETQKYCRSCGTDMGLVSHALKGQLSSRGAAGIHRGHSGRRLDFSAKFILLVALPLAMH
jgi:hypothetical protein